MLIRVYLHFIIGELRYHYKLRGFISNSKPLSYPEFIPCFSWVRVTRSLVLCACFCRSVLVLLSFFFWPLCCLFFFDIRNDYHFGIFKFFLFMHVDCKSTLFNFIVFFHRSCFKLSVSIVNCIWVF